MHNFDHTEDVYQGAAKREVAKPVFYATKLTLAIAACCFANVQSYGQAETKKEIDDLLEEVVVTGTRRDGVAPTETLSPVDVVGGVELAEQAAFDLTDSLTRISPSLNTQRFPIADGTAFIRPVTLRNLSPDQTLVLVNGTRRHRSALVNLQLAPLGTANQGSQAVDFSTIPAAAIKRIEVLRDGASAQYGSDAIAGVINVILNDADEGFSVSTQYGSYYENDGDRFSIALNGGFALGDRGFANITFERSTSDTTSRGNARPDAAQVAGVVGPGLVPFDGLGQRWGDPDVEAQKWFVNAGYDITDNLEIYSNASYSDNETRSGFFYRGPVLDPSEQFAARGTLQVDANEDFIPDAAPQSLVDSITASGLTPSDYLVPVADVAGASSASGFVLRNPIFSQFPGGYNPGFGADIEDYAVVVGLRGATSSDLLWDIRIRHAENEVDYLIDNTINPSLGALSPTSFKPGTLTQEEKSVNADFVASLDVGNFASDINVGFGFEYREETYEIDSGNSESLVAGPTAAFFGVGSDGFQGFPVDSEGSFDSESIGVYVDFEADVTDRLTMGTAVRYEDFDEFDSTTDFKVSGRYAFTDEFAMRATVNTGFRAPTPGQVNTLNITTTADSSGNLIPNGTYPVNNPIALALGSVELEPEESTSFTLGMVYTPSDTVTVTLDYYDIEIEDRLALQNNAIGAAEVTLLSNAGVSNANLLLGSNANFFTNAFDSEISGIDLNVTSEHQLAKGDLTVELRFSYNDQEVSSVRPGTINGSRVADLENQVPNDRTVLTFSYDSGNIFSGLVRINYYGDWKSTGGLFDDPADGSLQNSYGSETLVDVEARFTFSENYSITLGGENVFDAEPDDEADPTTRFLGAEQALTSPFGFNGGFWYVRAAINF